MVSTKSGFGLMAVILSAVGCGTPDAQDGGAAEVRDELISNGVSCKFQKGFNALGGGEREEFFGLLRSENLKPEELGSLAQVTETGCGDTGHGTDREVGSVSQAITGTYKVEDIEEAASGGGSYPSSIYRDSAAYSWMCNSGSPGTWYDPADFIAQYHVNNAYTDTNRPKLRVRGTNGFASCYIKASGNMTRVYSDSDIRMCIGYYTALLCTSVRTRRPTRPSCFFSEKSSMSW